VIAFDRAFAIRGRSAERVIALLTPELRALLMSLQFGQFTLTDAEFESELPTDLESVENLERALREAVSVARAVEQARSRAPTG
jgi:hypothetical protein